MKTFRQFLNEDFGDDDIFNSPYGPFSNIVDFFNQLLAKYGFIQWNDLENWINGQNGESMEGFFEFSLEWFDINGDGYFGPEDMEFFDFMNFITAPPPYGNVAAELPEEFLSIYGYGANGGVFDMSAFLEWWIGYIQDIIAQGEPYPEALEDYIQEYVAQGEGYSDENPWGSLGSGINYEDFNGKTKPNGEEWTEMEGGLGAGPNTIGLPIPGKIIPPGILETLGYDPGLGGKGNPTDPDTPPDVSYDFDGDGDVDFEDLLYLLSNYGEQGFDYDDLLDLLSKFGEQGLLPPGFPKPPRQPKQPPKQPPSPPPPGLAGPKG